MVGLFMVAATPLWADPAAASAADYARESAHLEKDEKKLERMQANRSLDDKHAQEAQQEFQKGTAERTSHDQQQRQEVRQLQSVDVQVTAGKKLKESQTVMDPLLESQRSLKSDIRQADRQAHNEKTVLSVQKRDMDSNARYRAIDDRKIEQKEKNIADDHKEMAKNLQPSELSSSK